MNGNLQQQSDQRISHADGDWFIQPLQGSGTALLILGTPPSIRRTSLDVFTDRHRAGISINRNSVASAAILKIDAPWGQRSGYRRECRGRIERVGQTVNMRFVAIGLLSRDASKP